MSSTDTRISITKAPDQQSNKSFRSLRNISVKYLNHNYTIPFSFYVQHEF